MDLPTSVAVSMLPVSRLKASAVLKELRQAGVATIERVLEAARGHRSEIPVSQTIAEAVQSAESALRSASTLGITAITADDPRYPALLACIPDPPPVLWTRGALECTARPAVAVIGSRAATPYAIQVARRLAAELADRGVVVVSGLARGVDAAAHEGCLEAGGPTIAVTGCGLDRVYPSENTKLSARIAGHGLLLSELGPGAPPCPEHFPLRNRIISGISLAVVVVEANEKSGSLITAACAMRQGRDVMAVPGSVLTGRNRGSHSLLKDGATIVESADDILEELGWRVPPHQPDHAITTRAKLLTGDPLLSKMEAGETYRLDELVEVTGTSASKLLPRLMELELLGHIEAPGAGRFVRPAGSPTGRGGRF